MNKYFDFMTGAIYTVIPILLVLCCIYLVKLMINMP